MSREPYYYDTNGRHVDQPGELCDLCGDLATIGPAGTLVPIPLDALHEEYVGWPGDLHAHRPCAERELQNVERQCEELRKALGYE